MWFTLRKWFQIKMRGTKCKKCWEYTSFFYNNMYIENVGVAMSFQFHLQLLVYFCLGLNYFCYTQFLQCEEFIINWLCFFFSFTKDSIHGWDSKRFSIFFRYMALVKLGFHRDDGMHCPTSSPAISLVKTIKGLSSNLNYLRWLGQYISVSFHIYFPSSSPSHMSFLLCRKRCKY